MARCSFRRSRSCDLCGDSGEWEKDVMWTLGGHIGLPHLKRLFLHLLPKVWKLKPTYPNAFDLRRSSHCKTTAAVTATKTGDATILETTSTNANATEQKASHAYGVKVLKISA